jgi:hypothetical protein
MRCQWGTTWENMQPWIVARRYREFDSLDNQVRTIDTEYRRTNSNSAIAIAIAIMFALFLFRPALAPSRARHL